MECATTSLDAYLKWFYETAVLSHEVLHETGSVYVHLDWRGVWFTTLSIFVACVERLKGFPEAIEAVFPRTDVQLCLVHLVRHSTKYVSFKARKQLAADLKTIYRAATAEEAEANMESFAGKWDARYPMISKSWRANCER